MWKIIILYCLSIAVQAAEIENIFGSWTHVAFYPSQTHAPVCVEYTFVKDSSNIECTCADKKRPTLVEFSMIEKEGSDTINIVIDTFPMLAVDVSDKVYLNISCTCGEKLYATRVVTRLVNPNYVVMYDIMEEREYTEAEQNCAYVFGKKVPTLADLVTTLESIEDLKNRNRAVPMCASDVDTKVNEQ